jgi:hypothetical protein
VSVHSVNFTQTLQDLINVHSLLWQLLSLARSDIRFTQCNGQESSSDFKYESRKYFSVSQPPKFEKRACSVYNG